MSMLPMGELSELVRHNGYWVVGVVVGLESMGIPLPGETILIAAALYAAGHDHNIVAVVGAAAAGAIVGDNVGFWIGREFGYRLLLRYGSYVGLTEAKIKLGQFLFLRHGTKVVFFGRFVAVLRVLAAFLAGVNQMNWARFLVANVAGGILWASTFGFGAYFLGQRLFALQGPFAIAAFVAAIAVFVGAIAFFRRHEAQLQAQADAAFPGPLRVPPEPAHDKK